MIAVAFHDGAACFEGEIRRLSDNPQFAWEQFCQVQRADRIRRQREVPSLQQRAAAAKGRVERHLERKQP